MSWSLKLKPVDAGSNTAAGTHTDQKPELSSLRKWCAAAEWWPAAEFWRPAGRDRVSSVRARPELVLAVGWRAAAAPRHAEPWRLRDHQAHELTNRWGWGIVFGGGLCKVYMGRICWCGRVLLQNLHAPFDGDRRPSKRCLQPCTVVLLALQSDPCLTEDGTDRVVFFSWNAGNNACFLEGKSLTHYSTRTHLKISFSTKPVTATQVSSPVFWTANNVVVQSCKLLQSLKPWQTSRSAIKFHLCLHNRGANGWLLDTPPTLFNSKFRTNFLNWEMVLKN